MPPLESYAERVTPSDPRDGVGNQQTIGDGVVETSAAKTLIPDSYGASGEAELWKTRATSAFYTQRLFPVLPGDACPLTRVIQPVKTDVDMIQQSGAESIVPAKAEVMRDAGSKKVLIERRGKHRISIQCFEITVTVGKKELTSRPPVLIYTEGLRGSPNGFVGVKKKIVEEPILATGDVGMHLQEPEYVQGNGTKRASDLVSGEGDAAADESSRAGGSGGIEDLAEQNGSIVTRVEDRVARSSLQRWTQQGGKVAGTFHIGGQSGDARCAHVVSILLPGEKEETLIMTVVQLGNPDRTAQTPAKVVLMISRLRRAV